MTDKVNSALDFLQEFDSVSWYQKELGIVLDYIIKLKEEIGGWIPVNERLPEDGQNVLFCDIDNDIMIGYHVKGRPNTHFSQDGTWENIKNVRAWMPLPEPYKAESEDEYADSN